jgi:acid phosphatase
MIPPGPRPWNSRGGGFSHLRPAIIVDVDETVLDNSPFQAQLVANNTDFSAELWKQWVELEQAEAIPGAVDFLNYVHARGVLVFYVTNRVVGSESHTRRNLEQAGFPLASGMDVILSKGENDWPSDKSSRRRWVAEKYRIVLLVGDDINDFVSGARTKSPEPRLALVRKYDANWGTRWIVLPNPLYGSWEASLMARNFSVPDAEKLRRKYSYLAPFLAEPVATQ